MQCRPSCLRPSQYKLITSVHLCPSQVWTFVQSCLILFSLATGIFVAASQNNLTFLRCIGREELFRRDSKSIQNWQLKISQTQPLKLLQAGQVWWSGVSGTFVGSLSTFSQHCHILVCPRCAWSVWGHLQVSENTYNNITRLVHLSDSFQELKRSQTSF